ACSYRRLWNFTAHFDSKNPFGLERFAPRYGPGTCRPRWLSVPDAVLVPLRPVPVIRTSRPPDASVSDVDSGMVGAILLRKRGGTRTLPQPDVHELEPCLGRVPSPAARHRVGPSRRRRSARLHGRRPTR